MSISAYPLHWPAGWPRTTKPTRSRFDVSFGVARDGVLEELRRLGARDIVISSNVELRRDGLPYAGKAEPDDPAVAVYFDLDGQQKCIPVDRWDRVKDNLRAIDLTVAAMRGLERWGAKHLVDAAFRGFEALPAGNTSGTVPWWEVLGVASGADRAQVGHAYRELVRTAHPDKGGDVEQWLVIQRAYEQARSGWS